MEDKNIDIGLRLLAGLIEPDSGDAEQAAQEENGGSTAARPSVERDKVTIH